MPAPTPQRSLRDAARLTGRAVAETVRGRRRRGAGERGIALLIVLLLLALVSTVSIGFTYNNRTAVWMSGNLQASTQAYFHARSSSKIALLAVNAKKNFPALKSLLSLLGKNAAQRLEIWPRACDFVQIFATGKVAFFEQVLLDFSEEDAVGAKSLREGVPPFSCTVSSEDGRVNLNRAATVTLAQPATTAGGRSVNIPQNMSNILRQRQQLWTQLGGLLQPMIQAGEFDSEEEMIDVVLNVIDWTDADETATNVDPNGNFSDGSGPEFDYGRYGYESKNAKMDTIGEAQLVEGMGPDVFCQIRDKLTVFATDKINVNDADLAVIKGVLCQSITDDTARAQLCYVPGLGGIAPIDEALIAMESCRNLKKAVYSMPFTTMSRFTQFFQQFPAALGTGIPIPVNPSIISQQLGVRTKMVRIEAEGTYGDTKRKMISVVDTSTGSLVHFHYE